MTRASEREREINTYIYTEDSAVDAHLSFVPQQLLVSICAMVYTREARDGNPTDYIQFLDLF